MIINNPSEKPHNVRLEVVFYCFFSVGSVQHTYINSLLGIYHYYCVTMLWMRNKINVGSSYVYFWCVCVCMCVCVQSLVSLIRLDRIKQVDIYIFLPVHLLYTSLDFCANFFWNTNIGLLWRGRFIYFFCSTF